MLDIKQIESFYPESLHPFRRNLVREYMQYKILEILYDSPFREKLVFMGGTAARILYQNTRFSEDLDFDNIGMKKEDFERLTALVQKKLNLEGYEIEVSNTYKGAFRCYLKVKDVFYKTGVSGHREEKLLVQLDTEAQKYDYTPEKIIINKFDVFLRINAVPLPLLLSQKLTAIFTRKRAMGRDFFDTVFLFGKTSPDLRYLKEKLAIHDMHELKKKLSNKCKELEFKQLAKDVEPFLFKSEDAKKVLLFPDFVEGM